MEEDVLDELADSWGVDRIDADLAWGTSKGAGVQVAILDTGIDKDLKANIPTTIYQTRNLNTKEL